MTPSVVTPPPFECPLLSGRATPQETGVMAALLKQICGKCGNTQRAIRNTTAGSQRYIHISFRAKPARFIGQTGWRRWQCAVLCCTVLCMQAGEANVSLGLGTCLPAMHFPFVVAMQTAGRLNPATADQMAHLNTPRRCCRRVFNQLRSCESRDQ